MAVLAAAIAGHADDTNALTTVSPSKTPTTERFGVIFV